MKKYQVFLDLTIGVSIEVDADDERQAATIAKKKVDESPFHYISQASSLVCAEVYDSYEIDD